MRVPAAGWVYADMAAEDTVALRGHYLHLAAVQRHLEAARIEEHLDLGPAMRFPRFYEVLSLMLLCALCWPLLFQDLLWYREQGTLPLQISVRCPAWNDALLSAMILGKHRQTDLERKLCCCAGAVAHCSSLCRGPHGCCCSACRAAV